MCGVIDDTMDYITGGIKELASHPLQTLGTAMLGPGLASGLDMAGLGFGSMISPTGNFSTGAWNDMMQANPDSSGLGLFHGINDVADKVAPAIAGGFAAGGGGLAGSLGSTTGDAAAGLGTSAFTTGLGDSASTLGGLEGSLGGAGLFGASAGTGTALGSAAAQGLGAGGLGMAGGDALGGTVGTTFGSGLGGSSLGTGLGATSVTAPASADGGLSLGGGALSTDGSQAAPGAYASGASSSTPGSGAPMGFDNPTGASAGADSGQGSLSSLYGPNSAAPAQPSSMFSGMNTTGISPAVTSPSATGNMDPSLFQNLSTAMKLFNTGMGAYQQHAQQGANNNYTNSINQIFSPQGAYAQQMQQTLARQDAAQGRNSQYGTRSVQLAAALAQAQANALGNNNYAHAATATPGASLLNGLFANFSSPQAMQGLQQFGQQAANYGSSAFNGLQNLFSGF